MLTQRLTQKEKLLRHQQETPNDRLGFIASRTHEQSLEKKPLLQKDILRKRFSALPQGLSADQVASTLGISLSHARQLANVLQYTLRRPRNIDNWKHLDWRKQDVELAKETKLSRERIRQVRQYFGMPKSPQHKKSFARRVGPDSANDVPAGLTITELAKRFKCWPETANKWCVEKGYTPARGRKSPITDRFKSLPPGLTCTEIRKRIGTRYQYAWNLAKKYGYALRRRPYPARKK